MNSLYSRTVAWVLMSIAATLVAWALELRDGNGAAHKTILALQTQLERLQAKESAASPLLDAGAKSAVAAQAKAWREAAQSHGSDARNTAVALDLARRFCAASGLKECQVKRSNLRTSGIVQATGISTKEADTGMASSLMPNAINVLARFDAEGVQAFMKALVDSGLLYRLERVNIVQNRAEWDVVFFMLSGDVPGIK